ncbi:hypothetical protein SASPL_103303 [Salvia splendens]|uniref:Chromo domain-containing protein n=1 Tax=Salvia splendens TaxID=180675 RepID=A0A8X9ACY6_SALSN|nr:hypothetical protein SASPL_103303 [Salvia splendens]
MTVSANKHRRDVEYDVGDLVYLRFRPHRQATLFSARNRKLAPRYFGPFRIEARIGSTAYRLQLPVSSRIHPVFHVSLLKRAIGEEVADPTLPEGVVEHEPPFLPEAILDRRSVDREGDSVDQVLVKWGDLNEDEATWMDMADVRGHYQEWSRVTDADSDNIPYIEAFALAFDPSKSPHYKVVCIRKTVVYTSLGWSQRLATILNQLSYFELEIDHDHSSAWVLRYEEMISQHECHSPFTDRTHLLSFITGSNEAEMSIVVYHKCGKISVYSFLDKTCCVRNHKIWTNFADTVRKNAAPYSNDVVVVILLHLPAKSLTRFKLVATCKHWLSIISAQQFCHPHTLRHPEPLPSLILRTHTSHCFCFNPVSSSQKLIPYSVTVPNSKILNSCNGLLLLQSVHPDPVEYHVYNSTTKQSRTISLTDSEDFKKIMGLTLAFDPSKSPHYKIVCVSGIEVFNSQSFTWRVCLEQLTAPTGANFSCSSGGGAASHCQLQESNGLLYHFIIVSHLGDKSIAVYELQEDYSQWLLKYHDEVGQLPGRSCILSYIKGEEGQSCTMLTHVPGKITLYSFLNKRSEEIIDLTNQPFYQEDSMQFDSRDVFHFGETLAPV